MNFLYIIWNASPEIFMSVRWYGLLFALGFLIGQLILTYMFKAEGRSERAVESITIYVLIGTLIGARLGHCLFYEPEYYLSHPLEILKVWKGGLASHGATIGILTAIWLYSRKNPDQPYFWVLDRVVILVALGGACIRFGNLMNSEIVGKPTDLPFAFVFVHSADQALKSGSSDSYKINKVSFSQQKSIEQPVSADAQPSVRLRVDASMNQLTDPLLRNPTLAVQRFSGIIAQDSEASQHLRISENEANASFSDTPKNTVFSFDAYGIPRHPAQLYEALSCLVIFAWLFYYWKVRKSTTPIGSIFARFVIILFTLRFFYEFLKENQVGFENQLPLNMGQILSIPMVLIGFWVLWKSNKGYFDTRRKTE